MAGWNPQNQDWEKQVDENWGSVPAAVPADTTPEQPNTDRDTAIPQGDGAASVKDDNDTNPMPAEPGANPEWVAQGRTQYDYENFTSQGGEYDGNARVYNWDGEEGDIGPEFPELEAELFGPPDKRDLPQGIDFTR